MIEFRFFGIPVRVEPMFWLTMALLGYSSGQSLLFVALFVMAAFVSVFVHELGHAFMCRHFGAPTYIVLTTFGGYAAFPTGRFSRLQSFLVVLAGPAIQLLLAFVLYKLYRTLPNQTQAVSYLLHAGFMISMWWALLNLIPVFPLDGGQLLNAVMGPNRMKLTFTISIIVAIVAAVICFQMGLMMMPFFFGIYAYQNFQMLQQVR